MAEGTSIEEVLAAQEGLTVSFSPRTADLGAEPIAVN